MTRTRLGKEPEVGFEELVRMMVESQLREQKLLVGP